MGLITITVEEDHLTSVVGMAESYNDDLESGLEDGTYEEGNAAANGADIASVEAAIEAAKTKSSSGGDKLISETDWKTIAGDLVGALNACVTQIEQMKGMFDDEDGNIQDALDAAEETSGRYFKVSDITPIV